MPVSSKKGGKGSKFPAFGSVYFRFLWNLYWFPPRCAFSAFPCFSFFSISLHLRNVSSRPLFPRILQPPIPIPYPAPCSYPLPRPLFLSPTPPPVLIPYPAPCSHPLPRHLFPSPTPPPVPIPYPAPCSHPPPHSAVSHPHPFK